MSKKEHSIHTEKDKKNPDMYIWRCTCGVSSGGGHSFPTEVQAGASGDAHVRRMTSEARKKEVVTISPPSEKALSLPASVAHIKALVDDGLLERSVAADMVYKALFESK